MVYLPDTSGGLAERLRSGLQIREDRFDSGTRLHLFRASFRHVDPSERLSSSRRVGWRPDAHGAVQRTVRTRRNGAFCVLGCSRARACRSGCCASCAAGAARRRQRAAGSALGLSGRGVGCGYGHADFDHRQFCADAVGHPCVGHPGSDQLRTAKRFLRVLRSATSTPPARPCTSATGSTYRPSCTRTRERACREPERCWRCRCGDTATWSG